MANDDDYFKIYPHAILQAAASVQYILDREKERRRTRLRNPIFLKFIAQCLVSYYFGFVAQKLSYLNTNNFVCCVQWNIVYMEKLIKSRM